MFACSLFPFSHFRTIQVAEWSYWTDGCGVNGSFRRGLHSPPVLSYCSVPWRIAPFSSRWKLTPALLIYPTEHSYYPPWTIWTIFQTIPLKLTYLWGGKDIALVPVLLTVTQYTSVMLQHHTNIMLKRHIRTCRLSYTLNGSVSCNKQYITYSITKLMLKISSVTRFLVVFKCSFLSLYLDSVKKRMTGHLGCDSDLKCEALYHTLKHVMELLCTHHQTSYTVGQGAGVTWCIRGFKGCTWDVY